MWRSPSAVSVELGPTIGRSGDSPVSDGASAGSAVNSDLTWSGWLVMTAPPSTTRVRILKTSPRRRRAPKTNSIWRTLKRSVCAVGASAISGTARRSAMPSGAGPAGDGGAWPMNVCDCDCGTAASTLIAQRLHRRNSAGADHPRHLGHRGDAGPDLLHAVVVQAPHPLRDRELRHALHRCAVDDQVVH